MATVNEHGNKANHMTRSDLDLQELTTLENLIDGHGIDAVLMAISEICGAKAEHVAITYQDTHLAKRWAELEGTVGIIVPKAVGL